MEEGVEGVTYLEVGYPAHRGNVRGVVLVHVAPSSGQAPPTTPLALCAPGKEEI